MTRSGQQDQAAVTEEVVTVLEGREAGIVGKFELDLAPAKPWQVDMAGHQPAQLGKWARQRLPFGLAHHDVGLPDFTQASDVVLVQVGHDGRVHVADGVASPLSPRLSVSWGSISKRASRS